MNGAGFYGFVFFDHDVPGINATTIDCAYRIDPCVMQCPDRTRSEDLPYVPRLHKPAVVIRCCKTQPCHRSNHPILRSTKAFQPDGEVPCESPRPFLVQDHCFGIFSEGDQCRVQLVLRRNGNTGIAPLDEIRKNKLFCLRENGVSGFPASGFDVDNGAAVM